MSLKNNRIIVTGNAGFIGYHVTNRLLQDGYIVVGIDNVNDYYTPALKHSRLDLLRQFPNFTFHQADICDKSTLCGLFEENEFGTVVHLAAQAGVRYSLDNPHAYVDSNLTGFVNILECCRHNNVQHLVYASSSSVYGLNDKLPFSEDDAVDFPVSLYAATKKVTN